MRGTLSTRGVGMRRQFLGLSLVTAVAVLAACSSDPAGADAGACKPAAVTAGLDLTAPVVTFKADVVPIYEVSCSLPSCHGSSSASNGIFLPKGQPDAVYANLVGKSSTRYAKQTLVVKGDPKASFLQRKIDGDLCTIDCGSGGCGDSMPRNNEALPEESRNKFRRWIAQGANFN